MAQASNGDTGKIQARALVATAVGAPLELQDIIIDPSMLKDDEVIVRFSHSGICHTDISAAQGVLPIQYPAILGHEGAGVIEALPPNFIGKDDFTLGDTVLCSFNSCDVCEHCQLATPSKCDLFFPINFAGVRADMTPIVARRASDGAELHASFFGQSSFASHSVVNVRCLVKTQTKIPLELVCAFGCGIQTGFGTVLNMLVPTLKPRNECSDLPSIKELGVQVSTARSQALAAKRNPHIAKHALAVFGAGAVGIAGIIAGSLAKDCIDTIIAVDLVDERLELAKKAGATHVINSTGLSPEETVERVQKATADGQGPRLIMEATGSAVVFGIAAQSMRPQGVVALVGAGPAGKTTDIDVATLLMKQGRLQGVIEGASDASIMVPYMIAQYERGFSTSNGHNAAKAHGGSSGGAFAVMHDLVKVYPPEQIANALSDAASGRVVKPVIRWG